MSALGPYDYTDMQAQTAWDSGTPIYSVSGFKTGNVASGALNVANWANLVVVTAPTGAQVKFSVFFYADEALTIPIGSTSVMLDPNIGGAYTVLTPCLASWAQVVHAPQTGGTNWTANCNILGSNRGQLIAGVNPSGYVFGLNSNIPAGGGVTQYPFAYQGGNAGLYTFGGNQGVTVEIDLLSTYGVWTKIDQYTVAANANDYRNVILPSQAWRAFVTNTSGGSINTGVVMSGVVTPIA